ncbi:MAG TPA: S8 family serine peptidase [Acidimicrobiales bacterium]|nr:S8 family serine peptidase [Acidimicrobiales bacterium]
MSDPDGTSNQPIAGRWSERVAYSESGGFAYRRGELFVPLGRAREAQALLSPEARPSQRQTPGREDLEGIGLSHFSDVVEELRAIDHLRAAGIPTHPNHVLFSHCLCCCGPHPALFWGNPFTGNPFTGNPFTGNPFTGNPFTGNPFGAKDYQPNPLALPRTSPEAIEFRATGWRPHSARPAMAPVLPEPPDDPDGPTPSVVVIDTGLAQADLLPRALYDVTAVDVQLAIRQQVSDEKPDADGDKRIDPMAGHGTFIAGIIKRIAPSCGLLVQGPLSGYGDVSEHDIGTVLDALLPHPPALLNLSFGGYAAVDMVRLGGAVRRLQDAGTVVVASAGNDSTCRPLYPAAFPGVVSVGALGPYGPAHFTNYGPWVRACAPGVDVISTFFTEWESPILDSERYAEWVCWSGTSFAAPAVVGALARAMRAGLSNEQAVARLIDDPGLFRIPGLGTVVNQTPWWQSTGGDV